jgi:hypothetical protein
MFNLNVYCTEKLIDILSLIEIGRSCYLQVFAQFGSFFGALSGQNKKKIMVDEKR